MYVSSEIIQHLKSQRSMRRRVGGEKVHDGLGQKIALGHLASPFFCSRRWTVHLQWERHEMSGLRGSCATAMLFPSPATFSHICVHSLLPLSLICTMSPDLTDLNSYLPSGV